MSPISMYPAEIDQQVFNRKNGYPLPHASTMNFEATWP